MLEAHGHTCALAADGDKALERLEDGEFDVMLLDVMMPVLDGWGVLSALSRVDRRPQVVIVSAKTADADIARGIAAGAVEYLTKPFTAQQITTTVARVASLTPEQAQDHRRRRLEALGGP